MAPTLIDDPTQLTVKVDAGQGYSTTIPLNAIVEAATLDNRRRWPFQPPRPHMLDDAWQRPLMSRPCPHRLAIPRGAVLSASGAIPQLRREINSPSSASSSSLNHPFPGMAP